MQLEEAPAGAGTAKKGSGSDFVPRQPHPSIFQIGFKREFSIKEKFSIMKQRV